MIKRALALVLVLALTACTVAEAAKRKRPPKPSPTQPIAWTFFYGQPNPTMNADGVSSNWTSSPYVEAGYWLKGWTTPFQPSQSISITYKVEPISGTPKVLSTECGPNTYDPSAKAALMIGNGTDSTYYDRAWWKITSPMTFGTHTITASFGNGSGWTFVSTEPVQYPTQWAAMLANVKKIGLTFNGCSSMGHGAYVVDGTVKVTIVSVTVQ